MKTRLLSVVLFCFTVVAAFFLFRLKPRVHYYGGEMKGYRVHVEEIKQWTGSTRFVVGLLPLSETLPRRSIIGCFNEEGECDAFTLSNPHEVISWTSVDPRAKITFRLLAEAKQTVLP